MINPEPLKSSKTHRNEKKKKENFTSYGEAQTYLPHITPRVPRRVHAKFHGALTKTVGARGKHTDTQTVFLLLHRLLLALRVTLCLLG